MRQSKRSYSQQQKQKENYVESWHTQVHIFTWFRQMPCNNMKSKRGNYMKRKMEFLYPVLMSLIRNTANDGNIFHKLF